MWTSNLSCNVLTGRTQQINWTPTECWIDLKLSVYVTKAAITTTIQLRLDGRSTVSRRRFAANRVESE